jgi:hypothetical protein
MVAFTEGHKVGAGRTQSLMLYGRGLMTANKGGQ